MSAAELLEKVKTFDQTSASYENGHKLLQNKIHKVYNVRHSTAFHNILFLMEKVHLNTLLMPPEVVTNIPSTKSARYQ